MSGVFIRYQCVIMREFYRAGAIDASTAVTPEEIHIKRNFLFKRLVKLGWIYQSEDKYYLNVEKVKTRPLAWKGITR